MIVDAIGTIILFIAQNGSDKSQNEPTKHKKKETNC